MHIQFNAESLRGVCRIAIRHTGRLREKIAMQLLFVGTELSAEQTPSTHPVASTTSTTSIASPPGASTPPRLHASTRGKHQQRLGSTATESFSLETPKSPGPGVSTTPIGMRSASGGSRPWLDLRGASPCGRVPEHNTGRRDRLSCCQTSWIDRSVWLCLLTRSPQEKMVRSACTSSRAFLYDGKDSKMASAPFLDIPLVLHNDAERTNTRPMDVSPSFPRQSFEDVARVDKEAPHSSATCSTQGGRRVLAGLPPCTPSAAIRLAIEFPLHCV
ncbi:hypothetical protein HYFRA_00000436 [Hymenoscyphus fraxineus]|uniref:Uncharacterized protein n=1 Tax=Hymenoscyphus fraxineus TaxID=746836 RepID=A0A9N9L1H7_9HELO|nr:hypothetical protein HYFRA_00000436 [Hymenoscyphus fraxineus]